MLSGVFSAEFGRGAGVVSVATKSGSNLLHGTVFEYLRNDAFDARNFFVRKVRAGRRQPGQGSEAAARPPSVRRRRRRPAGDSRALRRPQPHVLLRRLRRAEGEARPGVRQHRADGADADRRLQRLPRRQRQPDPDLRSADDAAQSRRSTRRGRSAPPTRSSCAIRIPGNIIPAGPHQPGRANVASIYPLPNGPGNFNNYTSTVNRDVTDNVVLGPHRSPASSTRTRSSCASTGAGSSSTRRRGRRPAACRRRRKPRRDSTSGRSSPASRTRG